MLHPAHVHFFKNFIKIMVKKNHEIYVTSRDKEVTNFLLKKYKINSLSISSIGNDLFSLGFELLIRNSKFLGIAQKIKPDLLMGIMGPTIATVGKILKIPSFVFYDSEFAKMTNNFVYPLATKVITPSCYKNYIGDKHITYNGFQELAYLHPNYFKPDPSIKEFLGLGKNEVYFILRLVGWKASHDIGHKGLSLPHVRDLIKKLEDYGHVLVSSERPIINKKYQLKISPEKFHSLLYYAEMYIGEGITMASESALLGVPSVLISPLVGNIGTLENLESYGLANNFSESDKAIEKITELLGVSDLKKRWQLKRDKMLTEKVDVTKFMVDLVEGFEQK